MQLLFTDNYYLTNRNLPLDEGRNVLISVSTKKITVMKGTRNLTLLIIGAIVLIFFVWGCSGYKWVGKR